MSADASELRELLHRAVDLACDILEDRRERALRAPRASNCTHPVDEVTAARAQRELERRGWAPKKAARR